MVPGRRRRWVTTHELGTWAAWRQLPRRVSRSSRKRCLQAGTKRARSYRHWNTPELLESAVITQSAALKRLAPAVRFRPGHHILKALSDFAKTQPFHYHSKKSGSSEIAWGWSVVSEADSQPGAGDRTAAAGGQCPPNCQKAWSGSRHDYADPGRAALRTGPIISRYISGWVMRKNRLALLHSALQ